VLIMNALDKAGNIAGTAIHKSASRCSHLAFQPLPAGKEPVALEPLDTGKELVGHLEPGSRHIHEAPFWETVERPQRADRKDHARLSRVVSAGSRGRFPCFVPQKNLALPIIKIGEPDAVGELQNGDKLRHAWEPSLARGAIGFKTVLRIVGLEVVFRIFRVN